MASDRVHVKLERARAKLELIAGKLKDTISQIGRTDGNYYCQKQFYGGFRLSRAARRLSLVASRLVEADSRIVSMAPLKRSAAKGTFHCFQRLPAELRIMIWEAAADPPPCTHYMDTHIATEGGGQPASYRLEDQGLWTACKQSRQAVFRAYSDSHRRVRQRGCSAASKKLEMHYRRLGRFNRSGRKFQTQLREFEKQFRKQHRTMFPMMDALHQFYDLGLWTALGVVQYRSPFSSRICKELRVATLFTEES